MSPKSWPLTSGRLKTSSLVLLSGEGTTIPAAEARALFLAYDPGSEFQSPDPRLLTVRSSADPFRVGSRIAFARRVGLVPNDRSEIRTLLKGRRVRFREFDLTKRAAAANPEKFLGDIDAAVDLQNPEYELTLVRGEEDILAITSPMTMSQRWSKRRPRSRAFFHPSAIFPKLSRALVNLSRCREDDVFLDPFAGTGSIPVEASIVGARVLAVDVSQLMADGALSNMKHFGQAWLGVVRADSTQPPVIVANAIATDMPYGRASSTRGRKPEEIVSLILPALASVLKSSSFLVLMHPQAVPVEGSRLFDIIEEHHLHVHKLLTRTITVLRRR